MNAKNYRIESAIQRGLDIHRGFILPLHFVKRRASFLLKLVRQKPVLKVISST